MNCWSHRVPALPTPLISLYSFVDGMACLFLRSDPRLNLKKKISGGGLTFGPPQYLYHGYALANIADSWKMTSVTLISIFAATNL